ncbi:MAG: hypothetical protein ACSHYA_08895 [Opitutaceae bacterium]
MNTPILILLVCLFPFTLFANLTQLTSSDGRTISVLIDAYSVEKNAVAVRINGEGSVVPIPMDRLDEASQKAVLEWNELNILTKFITVRTDRVTSGKGERLFEIELSSLAKSSVEGIRVEYFVPIKKTKMVKEDGDAKNPKYKKVTDETVIKGEVEFKELKPQSSKMLKSQSISISETQMLDQGKGKDPKKVVNNHSIKGILLKLYMGDQLIREHESQNGVKQLIAKYRK